MSAATNPRMADYGAVQDASLSRGAGTRRPDHVQCIAFAADFCRDSPVNKLSGRFMIRLSTFTIGLLLIAPLAAHAADATYTDRIIVKYRTTPAGASAQASQAHGTDLSAQRFGVAMSRLHVTGLGSQVLKADRRLSLAEA